MYKLIIQDDEGKTTVVPRIRDESTIGRKEGNTIRLTERNVSRRHARLVKASGNVVIEDLDSYNGIRVNGTRIQGRVSVAETDRIQIGDYLLEGGENSWFYGWKLNRGYAADGSVTVDPELVFREKGWDDELLSKLPDIRVSLETSVMVVGDIAYLNSSGGLLQGWDLSRPLNGGGNPTRVFRFWTGDDSDATIVAPLIFAYLLGW